MTKKEIKTVELTELLPYMKNEKDGYIIKIGTAGLSTAIPLPDELLEKMGWNTGDEIDISITENWFDFGEVQSIILRNLTKER